MGFWKRKENEKEAETDSSDDAARSKVEQLNPPVADHNQRHIQPGVVMLGISLPMFARAYYLYHSPLQDVLEKVAARNKVSVQDIKEADIGVRRAAGMAVAGRALKLASLISFGSFGLLGAAVFFTMGWKSFDEGISATRRWGNSKRKKLDHLLGVEKRVDEDHPEVIARKAMTREQEAEYLAKRYWISKDKPTEDNNTPGE